MFKFSSAILTLVFCIPLFAQNENNLSSKGKSLSNKKESIIIDSLSKPDNLSSKATKREFPSKSTNNNNHEENGLNGVLSERKHK